jgi:hypothetical protein
VAVTYTLNDRYGNKRDGQRPRLPAQQRNGRFRVAARQRQRIRPHSGRSRRHRAAQTPLSSMTPTIVLRDGKPFLALGSPGSQTIINTVLETIVNVIDWKMNVQDAVNWPRIPSRLDARHPGDGARLFAGHHRAARKVGLHREGSGKAGRLRRHPVLRRMAGRRCRSAHRRIGERLLKHESRSVDAPVREPSAHVGVADQIQARAFPPWRSSARASTWTIATRRRLPNWATGSAIRT